MVNNWLLIFDNVYVKLFLFDFQIVIACFKCSLQLGFQQLNNHQEGNGDLDACRARIASNRIII